MAKYRVDTDNGSYEVETDEPSQEPSKLESAARGGAQGLTLGHADELTGALESMTSDKSYEQARNESRTAYEAARQANPKTYGAANIAGSIPGYIALDPVAAGAIQGEGESNAPLLSKETALHAGIGAAFGKGAELAGKAIQPLANKAVPWIGENLFGKNPEAIKFALSNPEAVAKAPDLGQTMAGLVTETPEQSSGSVLDQLKSMFKQGKLARTARTVLSGADVGIPRNDVITAASNAYKQYPTSLIGKDFGPAGYIPEVVQNLNDTLGHEGFIRPEELFDYSNNLRQHSMMASGHAADALNSVANEIDGLLEQNVPGFKGYPEQRANLYKNYLSLKKQLGNDPEKTGKLLKETQDIFQPQQELENIPSSNVTQASVRDLLSPETLQTTRASIAANDINTPSAGLSPMTSMAARVGGLAVGSAVGHPFIGYAVGEAAGRGFGKQALNSMFKGMLNGTTLLNSLDQGAQQALTQHFGQYAPAIMQAAQRGPSALAVTHYVLSQKDENYRSLINGNENEPGIDQPSNR